MLHPSGHLAAIMATVGKAHPSNAPSAAFYGRRCGNRHVATTVKCALFEADTMPSIDAPAPTDERHFTAYIVREEWGDVTAPQIGDWVLVNLPKDPLQSWCRVAFVHHMVTGDFRVSLSYDPKRATPPWLT